MSPILAQTSSGLTEILARIAAAATACGRSPEAVTLTAVSKQQAWAAVEPVLAAGQRVFGENRVQEAQGRWSEPRERLGAGLELRLIGPLQTNKVREAVALFDVVESLDRARLAERLARESQSAGRGLRVYVQVNTGEESQKSGVAPGDADAFVDVCRRTFGLQVEGLMCIPPAGEPAAPHFALLAKIARRNGLSGLSMGMSGDFETAIAHGATCVRVGSALFGARVAPAAAAPGDS